MPIQKVINDKIEQEQIDRAGRVRSGLISPSSFGRCFRYQIWNRKNEPPTNPPDLRTLRVFKCGHLFHDFVESHLPPHQREVEIRVDDIYGFADIVLPDEVVDVKSQHSKSFWYMEKSDYNIEKEKISNILQVCCYAHLLKKPKFTLMFVSKDDLCIAEYSFFTDKYVHLVNEELKALRGWWIAENLPPKQPRAYGFDKKTGISNECGKYCSFRDKCKT